MKLLLKSIIYALIVVCLITASILLYRAHPEVQLAFIIPGVFILVYSLITDDIGIKQHVRSRNFRFSRDR
jgi:membrane protein YdbS with pleckstrin-like domain